MSSPKHSKNESSSELPLFPSKHNKVIIGILIAVVALGVIPLLAISFFNHPNADDFSYSYLTAEAVRNGGNFFDLVAAAVQTSAEFMQKWQGLYAAGFILAFQPAIFGEEYYWITGFFMVFVCLLGFLSIFHSLNKYVAKSTSKAWILIAVVSWFFFLMTMPQALQGLYWFNGAVNYMFFWVCFMFVASLELAYCNTKGPKSIAFLVMASLLEFWTAGGNHVTAFASIMISFGLAVIYIIKDKKFLMVIPVIVGIIGLAIVMTAPGTAVRSGALGWEGGIFNTLKLAVSFSVYSWARWYANLAMLGYMVVTIPLLRTTLLSSPWKDAKIKLWHVLVCLVLGLAITYFQMCVPVYAMGWGGESRLKNVLYATDIVTMSVILFAFIGWVRTVNPQGKALRSICDTLAGKNAISLVLIVLSSLCMLGGIGTNYMLMGSSSVEAVKELASGQAAQYSAEMWERANLYNSDAKEIVVQPLTVMPELLYFDDNPGYLEDYYGKTSITIAGQETQN